MRWFRKAGASKLGRNDVEEVLARFDAVVEDDLIDVAGLSPVALLALFRAGFSPVDENVGGGSGRCSAPTGGHGILRAPARTRPRGLHGVFPSRPDRSTASPSCGAVLRFHQEEKLND